MAKQKGLIQFEGTFGNLNFYFRKGVAVARKSGGGFNGKAIKTKASMVRVRENGSEFGAASRVKKLLRLSVQEALLNCSDETLHRRMMTLVQDLKVHDLFSERGKRSVWAGLQTNEGRHLFAAFLFTPKQAVFPLFDGVPVVSDFGARCDFNGLSLQEGSFKKSATHVVLTYFVVDYAPENLAFTKYTAVPVTVAQADVPVILNAFEIMGLPPVPSYRVSYLAVQFYQNTNGLLVALKEQGMTGLRAVGFEASSL
jgi:hypothetical protein